MRWGRALVVVRRFLPSQVLVDHAAEFYAELTAELSPHTANDRLTEVVSSACELARKPAPV